jgi:hypothetical protein
MLLGSGSVKIVENARKVLQAWLIGFVGGDHHRSNESPKSFSVSVLVLLPLQEAS